MPRRNLPRCGVTTVEFAIAVSLLFIVVFSTIEFSRVSMLRHAVDSAAYEGARNAISPGATVSDAEDRANQLLAANGLRDGTVTVEPNPLTESATSVRVRVELPVDSNSWLVRFLGGRTVTSSCQLMTERPIMVQAEAFVVPPPPPPPPPEPTPGPLPEPTPEPDPAPEPAPQPEPDPAPEPEPDPGPAPEPDPPPPTPTLPPPEPAPEPAPPPPPLL